MVGSHSMGFIGVIGKGSVRHTVHLLWCMTRINAVLMLVRECAMGFRYLLVPIVQIIYHSCQISSLWTIEWKPLGGDCMNACPNSKFLTK